MVRMLSQHPIERLDGPVPLAHRHPDLALDVEAVRIVRVLGQHPLGLFEGLDHLTVLGQAHRVPFIGEDLREQLADSDFVVDDQYRCHFGPCATRRAAARL